MDDLQIVIYTSFTNR